MNRGYYVYAAGAEAGFAVVAPTAKEARKIAFADYPEDVEWIDLRCRWVRGAAVCDLQVGIVHDARDALVRGLYSHLSEYPCDRCGNDGDVISCHGRALCEVCVQRERTGRRSEAMRRENALMDCLRGGPRTGEELPYEVRGTLSGRKKVFW